LEILEEMDRVKCAPNVISYSTLMGGLFRVGKLKEVVGVFEEMLKRGIVLDALAYDVLINGFVVLGF
jgi:pentatricopeptide repeat protein